MPNDGIISAKYGELGDLLLSLTQDRVWFAKRQAQRWTQIADLEEDAARRRKRADYRRTPSGMLRTATPLVPRDEDTDQILDSMNKRDPK